MNKFEDLIKAKILIFSFLFAVIFFIILIYFSIKNYHLISDQIYSTINNYYKNKISSGSKERIDFILKEIDHNQKNINIFAQKELEDRVNEIVKISSNIYNNLQGRASKEEIKKIIFEIIADINTDKDNYIFVIDSSGIIQYHPTLIKGTNSYDFKDIKGKSFVHEIIEKSKKSGQGFVEYYWYKLNSPDKKELKLIFSKIYAPLDIIICKGYYYSDILDTLNKKIVNIVNSSPYFNSNHVTTSIYSVKSEGKIELLTDTNIDFVTDSVLQNLENLDNIPILRFDTKDNSLITFYNIKFLKWVVVVKDKNSFFSVVEAERSKIINFFYNNNNKFFILIFIIFLIFGFIGYYFTNITVKNIKYFRESLEQKEKFHRKLINTLPIPIFIKRLSGDYIDCNDEFSKFFGMQIDDLKKYKEEGTLNEIDILTKIIQADILLDKINITDGLIKVTELEMSNVDGELKDIILYKSYYQGVKGETEGIIGVMFDITKQKELEKSLTLLSYNDPLTNIFNKRYFDKFIKSEFDKFKRYNIPFSLISFDIDKFKNINDNYGHPFGDIILKELTSVILQNIRVTDVLARVGGEEFAIIVSNPDFNEVLLFAEKLRREVEEHNFCNNFKITISLGVTKIIESDTVDTLIKRVDEALYNAKNMGRNRVESLIGKVSGDDQRSTFL